MRFIIVVGGGYPSRMYQRALTELGAKDSEDLDWIGIYSCRLNAQLLRLLLKECAHPELIREPGQVAGITAPVAFAGGIKPGASSDYVAVTLARAAQAKIVVNITNTSHVFDKDPAKNPDARAFETLTWDQYRTLIPATWTPGLHSPFDPGAAALAEESGIEVYVVGKEAENIQRLLAGEEHVGTRIHA